jgi:hypothetical protein
MAEKTVISIEVEGTGKAINSIKELKAELKAAQSAALNGDGKAAKRVAELKDKMDDLKDTTKSLQGSGVEKISSGFSMLGQGFKDFDFDKIKTGFKGVGAAMSAIPIFLIIEGISYLVQNFDELSKGSGFLATILRSVGDAITWLVDGFTDLIGVTSESSRAIEDQGEAMVKANEKSQEALQGTTSEFDRQLAVAKAAGKSTIEIEKAKQQAIIDTNFQIAKGIEAQVRAGGEFTDEMKKQLSGSLEAIKNAKVKEYEITENDNKAKQEQYKKHLEEKLIADKKRIEDINNLEINDKLRRESDLAIRVDLDKSAGIKKLEEKELELQGLQGLEETYRQIDFENLQSFNEKKKAEDLKNTQNGIELANQSLQATQNLTDIFFNYKISKAKKGSKEEEDLARKQFNINKALQIGLATIDGFKAISASLALSPVAIGPAPNPAGIASLAFVAISTAATIAKIASSQFKGAGGGGGGGETPTVGSPSIPSGNGTPSIAAPQQNTTTFTGNNNNNFNQPPIKTYVVETDLRNSTNTIDKIKDQATF